MAKNKNAKIASKNDPSTRGKSKEVFWDGKKVVPALFVDVDNKRRYMTAQYEDGRMVMDEAGIPLSWSKVSSSS